MRRKTVYLAFLLASLLILLSGFFFRRLLESLPAVSMLEEYFPRLTTRIYDAEGNLISELFTEQRTWITLQQIPVDLQNAFIAIEDDKFFKHWGISFRGMTRAAIKNFLAGRVVQGGSTITQQLSKLIFLTQEKTFGRKARELLLALQIERRFSKEEILQMYLNQVYFGHGAYGVAAAARHFFGKAVGELTLSECALLAGLPRLPGYYSPFNHPQRAAARRATVLNRMAQLKFITREEQALAKDAPLQTQKFSVSSSQAPYFVEYIRQQLEAKYGADILYRGGLSVYTTLDLKMQQAAESILLPALEKFDKEYGMQAEILRAKQKTEDLRKSGTVPENFVVKPSTTIPPVQGALLALDVKTGAIRTMVGGRDFKESQFNRAVQAKRQPGSAFKAFVWLAALERELTPASIVNDLPAAFYNDGHDWRLLEGATDAYSILVATQGLPEDRVWVPKNYDGKYFGPITLRRALAFSRNLVSIRLIDYLHPRKVIEWAKKCGIQSQLDPVLSLSLGTSVISLLELVNAYGTIAAEGIHKQPYAILRVTDFEGRVLEENSPKETEVIPAELNYLITHLLRSVILEGTGRGARRLNRPAAGKTGTSQDQRDLWFVGFTPDLVSGIWVGYDDFSSLGKKLSAGGIVVPWWTDFTKEALSKLPERDFSIPGKIVFVKIDRITGTLATENCPKTFFEAFASGTEPQELCPVDHSAVSLPEMETEE